MRAASNGLYGKQSVYIVSKNERYTVASGRRAAIFQFHIRFVFNRINKYLVYNFELRRAVLVLWHAFLFLGLRFFPPFFFFCLVTSTAFSCKKFYYFELKLDSLNDDKRGRGASFRHAGQPPSRSSPGSYPPPLTAPHTEGALHVMGRPQQQN
jgi:hypothetical protein